MLNILIAHSNLNFSKRIINNIITKNKNLKLVGLSTNLQETLDMIYLEYPDVIVYDVSIYQQIKLSNLIKAKDYNPVILVNNDINHTSTIINATKLDLQLLSADRVESQLNELVKRYSFSHLKNKSLIELQELNFNLKMTGTLYLLDCLVYSYQNESALDNLNKNLYPAIALKHSVDYKHIKWNIIKSINDMYRRNSIQKPGFVKKYFNLPKETKPTAKIILNTLVSGL